MSSNSMKSQFSKKLPNFRNQIQKLKSPFMQSIKHSRQSLHLKASLISSQQIQPLIQQVSSQVIPNNRLSLDTQQNYVLPHHMEQQGNAQQCLGLVNQQKELQLVLKEWKTQGKFRFNTGEQVRDAFHNVFQKRLQLVKNHQNRQPLAHVPNDEKIMINSIFAQLEAKDKLKGQVTIKSVIEFFRQNPLFYLFYNIPPTDLKYVLRQFSRTKPEHLTCIELLHVFLMQRPLIMNYEQNKQKVVQKKCVLQSQGWVQLKNLFDSLDTFGNQTIWITPFFKKIQFCPISQILLAMKVIQFPQIDRFYTLRKIIFQLENKYSFKQKVQWKQIQSLLTDFNHKQEPTLDMIFQKNLQNATIPVDSNYFILSKQVIQQLKLTFQRSTKYSNFFVNTKVICSQLLDNQQIKQSLHHPVRQINSSKKKYINMEEALRLMAANAQKYIDLDQLLEYFSIKGPTHNIVVRNFIQQSDSQSQEQHITAQQKKLIKMRSLNRFPKDITSPKWRRPLKKTTNFQQFNLKKRQKQTIREKKLKQMIQQKQQIELKQLRNKFKANPIPADLNPQRILLQKKRQELKIKRQHEQFAKQRKQDKQIISYLKANTKLFSSKSQDNSDRFQQFQRNKSPMFTHKPVPWFVHANLLTEIENQKSKRKQMFLEIAKTKYIKNWNNLPDFLYENLAESQENSILDEIMDKQNNKHKVPIKSKPVPNFEQLHQQFQQQLEMKKKQFRSTKIVQFKLTSPKALRSQASSSHLTIKKDNKSSQKWRQILLASPSSPIPSTKKCQQLQKHNQKQLQQKQSQAYLAQIKQSQRVQKQKNFGKYMSKKLHLQQQSQPNLQKQTSQKIKQHKKTIKTLQIQTENQLSQIYARVLQRPFLFQAKQIASYKGNNQNSNAKNQYIKRKSQHFKGKKLRKTGKRVVKHIQPIDMNMDENQDYYYREQQQYNPHNPHNQYNSQNAHNQYNSRNAHNQYNSQNAQNAQNVNNEQNEHNQYQNDEQQSKDYSKEQLNQSF